MALLFIISYIIYYLSSFIIEDTMTPLSPRV